MTGRVYIFAGEITNTYILANDLNSHQWVLEPILSSVKQKRAKSDIRNPSNNSIEKIVYFARQSPTDMNLVYEFSAP